MMKEYKKNVLYLLLAGFFIGATALGMDKVAGQIKTFGQKAQTQVDKLKAQLVAQAKKALETSDPQLLQLAKKALDKAQKSVLLPQAFKKQLAVLSSRIDQEIARRAQQPDHHHELKVGVVTYLPITAIRPGQLRYAKNNVDEKAAKQKITGLIFDSNHSSLAESGALPIIKGPLGYVLVDGHHDFLGALQVGATTVPVKLVEDLSDLSEADFNTKAMKEGYIHPYKIGETTVSKLPDTISMTTMQDDPNRWFAAIIARKCPSNESSTKDSISQADKNSYALNYPVYVKDTRKGVDRPFIEFLIADVLYKNNIKYDYSMGNNPPQELVEQARQALKANPIERLRLIPEPILYTEVNGGNICAQPEFKVPTKTMIRFAE